MTWSDEQWDRLETYVVEFGHLRSDNQFLYDLQLEFSSDYISSDVPTIQKHMEELLQNKSIYSRDNFNWDNNKTKLMNEVDSIILSFGLQPYHDLSKPPIRESKHTDVPAKRPPVVPIAAVPASEPVVSQIRRELPKLTKNERRMSLNLMQTPQMNHTRSSSFSKPLVTTSTVNVLAKPELSQKDIPNEKKEKKEKFNLTLIIPKRNAKEVTVDKKLRRASLVGENLPMYIKDQLLDRKLNRKKSRLQDLLANSQSLYVHKDTASLKSESQTGTSDYSPEVNSESDDDKEYVLPNLITKYYEQLEEEEEEEDVDFVDVNGSSGEELSDKSLDEDDYLFRR